MKKEFGFLMVAGRVLILENLFAKVRVGVSNDAHASIVMSGDEAALNDVDVVQNAEGNISITGKTDNWNGSLRSSISVSSNIVGNNIVVCNGTVIVDGKVINSNGPGKLMDMGAIEILVPEGTSIEIETVQSISILGVGGKINARLSGQNSLNAVGVKHVKARCSGLAQCDVEKVSGSAKLKVSGNSSVSLHGNLDDVEAEASGCGTITITGDCQDLDVEASGASNVIVHGRVMGNLRQRKSGVASIVVR